MFNSFRRRLHVGTANESGRHAWVRKALRELPPGWRLLDAGAGEQPYRANCAHLRYVSQDFARYDGRGDGIGLQRKDWRMPSADIVSDITSISEPDNAFDAVLCTEVLEHVPDPVAALRELARLLRSGGVLILTAPFAHVTHFSPYFYYTGFSRNFYEYWLPRVGLEIVELTIHGNYFEVLAQELLRLRHRTALEYGGRPVRWVHRKALGLLLRFLETLSQRDRGSETLMAYGVFVRARKL